MRPIPCPPVDRLRLLLAEALPPAEHDDLVSHLDGCGACQHQLENLAGACPGLLDAAATLPAAPYSAEASLARVLEDLKGDPAPTLPALPRDAAAAAGTLLTPTGPLGPLLHLEHYEVREVLGQGAMGVVLKAHEPALKRWVAIKVMAPELAADPVARQRFGREARAAAAVRHEHVVTIHAVSEIRGLPFLVMEYVEGGSLQDYLDLHGPPDWREAARLGAEVAAGLAAAHARGLVHRDIKPSNILLQADGDADGLGRARIGDFGLARAADEVRLTLTGTVMGTPMYMAPEQARCESVDERADLFSLGSVLYTLCTGQEPFPFGSPVAVLRQVCETIPRPVRHVNPAIPPWLAAVIERLHAKRPADRLGSAAEVAQLLRYNLEHPDAPRLVAPLPVASRRPRRKRLAVAALVAVPLLACGLLVSESLHWTHLTGWVSSALAGRSELPLRATLQGHTGLVWSVAYAPDGKTLATGGDDTTLRFWDPATGRQVGELPGHGSAVQGLAFTHSGKLLISGGADGTLRPWDMASRTEQPELVSHNVNVRRFPISPDDRTVAVVTNTQEVELWDLADRTVRHKLTGLHGSVMALAFSPDGKFLATGDTNGRIWLWDPDSGAELTNFRGDRLSVRALAFSPDTRTLASAGTGDHDVKLWDVARRRQTATLAGFENGALNVAFSPDGRLLAGGSRGGTVKVWEVASGQPVATVDAHQGSVYGLAFSPDGRTLATVGEDHVGRLWDLTGLYPRP
jgi:WD40 repeat protein/serine/threonine protein kinase